MKIDIHRHAADPGKADRVIRNLFHYQAAEISAGKYYSAGLHPWQIDAQTLDEDLSAVRSMAEAKQVLAIGETGLDKTIRIPFGIQEEAFVQQIGIAEATDKPMIIHCVRAYNEISALRREASSQKAWIIHWFNASPEMGLQLVKQNFFLSFGHMLFNTNSKAFQAYRHIPPDRIFLETDDSAYDIKAIYEQAALLQGIELAKLEKQIENNFVACFGIEP